MRGANVSINIDGYDEDDQSTESEIFLELTEILRDIMGEKDAQIMGVRRESSFVSDLMMEKNQIAAFAERVHIMYGSRVDFVEWLTKMPFRQLLGMKVGDISAFITSELTK
jgi:hypothetical protein